ncbi:DUF3455 domain-containing protein [Actinoplanes sp. M2I2]|uniref:DUF3455 domain-containing protein n=1 Tax=Actinoplanes sp. M2I2 TaxID=1734444 RepID=UPI002021AAE0|nr:DUF3455 domain-containing protein [Actinoplanes sp. M2I2]
MRKASRSRNRVFAAIGMAGVVGALGAVTYQASAAEVEAPATVAAPAEVAAPAAVGPDARRVGVPRIPAAIRPPAGSRPVGAYVVAKGTQTYTCTGGVFTGASVPEAQLVGTGGRIHHFGGPSWQSKRDGSLITAKKTAESPRAGTIAELLLTVDTHSGRGLLGNVAYISRLQTSGGVAPAGACEDGATKAVPYGAVYVFWAAKQS